jgi:ribosomal protein S18 acetylase RimI-like enzyme
MISFTNTNIQIAELKDATALTILLNSAYRGESSKKGWTTEAHLIAGDVRTNDEQVVDVIKTAGSVMLKYIDEKNKIIGCVNLQKHGNKIYLGMFSVFPEMQGSGIGKKILQAAEEYTLQSSCSIIYMTVISARTELIDWYKRHGYVDTNERKPFVEDDVTGKHLEQLTFAVLEKKL